VSSQSSRVRDALARVDGERVGREDDRHYVRIGLLGRGIGSSLTPIMHEAEGQRLGLNYRYDLVDFDRLELLDEDLGAVLDGVREAGYRGVNVTYPFKQAVIAHLGALAPEARAIGAVNTVVVEAEGLSGHNTDCWGFAESVRQGLGPVETDRVVQVGAGGAGAAVAQALAELGARQIDIVDVDMAKAQQLAQQVAAANGIVARGVKPETLPEIIGRAAGVVNATPVGMEKLPGLPFDPQLLAPTQWVADIIYFPRETDLIRQARGRGCRVLAGGGMAVHQAVRAFALFSGLDPDSAEMARTFARYA
jgi:shikimate dehydrogenase